MAKRKFNLETPHLYEIWADEDFNETSMFSPEDQTAISYDLATKNNRGYRMKRVASTKCTYAEALRLVNELIDDHINTWNW